MDYQTLYRKYRPQRFDEVIGQDHITRTLTREVVELKVAHAYLFAGPRGTGKTTSARLLAKALNCVNRQADGEPDNECVSCIEIAEGRSLDVMELDAASHNKVDDVREIRMNVGTVAASSGARRIYILDEAHMLSRAAGNALLKTLEEPPDHVVFVLATTEPYKMLDTIRSRTQRFDFHPVPVEILIDHLAEISCREEFSVEQEALAIIASHALGSVRDALSLLEQVAALGSGVIESSSVVRSLGLAAPESYGKLVQAIADQNAPDALTLIASLSSRGVDLRRFVAEALAFFRGLFLSQYSPNLEEVADEPLATLEEWRRYAALLSPGDVLRSIDGLAKALADLRDGREERLVVELAVLQLTRPETVADVAAFDARITRLESRVRSLASTELSTAAEVSEFLPPAESLETTHSVSISEVVTTAVADFGQDGEVDNPGEPSGEVFDGLESSTGRVPLNADLDIASFEAVWPAVVARIRDDAGPRRHAWLKEAIPTRAEGGTVTLEMDAKYRFHYEQIQADVDLKKMIEAIAGSLLDGGIEVVYHLRGEEELEKEETSRAPDDEDLLHPDDSEIVENDDPTAFVVEAFGGEILAD